ncbi:MAG: radical SAM/SPASM domain-containing protein [Nanobdellota archaeon]
MKPSRLRDNLGYLFRNKACLPAVMKNHVRYLCRGHQLRTVELALTYKCQCSCYYCSAEAFRGTRRHLTQSQFRKVIDECISLGAIHFMLTGGEPLLGEWYDIASYIKSKGRICSLVTNGALVREQLDNLAILDLIEISIDSVVPGEHDSVRGMNGLFADIMAIVPKIPVKTMLNFVVRRENVHTLHRLDRLSQKMRVPVNLGFIANVAKSSRLLTGNDFRLIESCLAKPNFRWCGEACYGKPGCSAGSQKMYITPYGDVSPCPLIPESFGNVTKEPLDAIRKRMLEHPSYATVNEGKCLPACDPFRSHSS